MGVHIISMSWTIPGDYPNLDQAVMAAYNAGILMFGSASDQGANTPDNPYMAKLSNKGEGSVICIGGAREDAYGDKKAVAEAEFFFPGQTQGIPTPLPQMKSSFGSKIGSSVATALASGLTALIMHLVDISKYGEDATANYRSKLQNPKNVRKIFLDLLPEPRKDEPRTSRIIPVTKYFKLAPAKQLIKSGNIEAIAAALDGRVERILW